MAMFAAPGEGAPGTGPTDTGTTGDSWSEELHRVHMDNHYARSVLLREGIAVSSSPSRAFLETA